MLAALTASFAQLCMPGHRRQCQQVPRTAGVAKGTMETWEQGGSCERQQGLESWFGDVESAEGRHWACTSG